MIEMRISHNKFWYVLVFPDGRLVQTDFIHPRFPSPEQQQYYWLEAPDELWKEELASTIFREYIDLVDRYYIPGCQLRYGIGTQHIIRIMKEEDCIILEFIDSNENGFDRIELEIPEKLKEIDF